MAEQQVMVGSSARQEARENNRLLAGDEAAHNWYRFVLSFPPHLVRDYLVRFRVNVNQMLLDPFCGTGTTLVECKKRGISSMGIESNPVAWFASRVKVDWGVDPDALLEHAEGVAAEALGRLQAEGIEETLGLPLFRKRPRLLGPLRTLPPEVEKLLLKNSISSLPLHKTLLLLDVLSEDKPRCFAEHERLALGKALVSNISNLEFGPEVGVGPAK